MRKETGKKVLSPLFVLYPFDLEWNLCIWLCEEQSFMLCRTCRLARGRRPAFPCLMPTTSLARTSSSRQAVAEQQSSAKMEFRYLAQARSLESGRSLICSEEDLESY